MSEGVLLTSESRTPDEPRPCSLLQQHSPATGRSLSVSCRMLRSPSHESVTTDLSLFSVSSSGAADRACLRPLSAISRGASPNAEPGARVRHADIPEVHWFEEENDLIRSCAMLSSALGLQKSFSTSDISHLPLPDHTSLVHSGQAASELALNSLQRSGYLIDHSRLDQTSRSCSTWVAVGDIGGTSQLPSPHGRTCDGGSATGALSFTAADFIRSMNKKVRQNYIRRKLHTTYKALERMSQSEFNLDRLEAVVSAAETISTAAIDPTTVTSDSTNPGPTQLIVPTAMQPRAQQVAKSTNTPHSSDTKTSTSTPTAPVRISAAVGGNTKLTINDVERERGKPLTKYERNMMIFNWLHTLDEAATEEVSAQ